MDERLLDILACPLCKGPLQWHRDAQCLVCRADRLAYPVVDGVPAMLEEEESVRLIIAHDIVAGIALIRVTGKDGKSATGRLTVR